MFNPAMDHLLFACAADYGSAVLGGLDAAGLPQVCDRGLVQPPSPLFRNDLRPGEYGDVFQHGLAAVAKAGGLDGQAVDGAPQLVDHQYRERLALHILGDDHQVAGHLQRALQHRHQFGGRRNLLVCHQDVRILDDGFHAFRVGYEVRADVAAVEVHAFDVLGLGLDALAFLDGDHALGAHLFQHVGKHIADFAVVGGDGGDLGHLVAPLHRG